MNITLENIKTAISNATIDGNFNSDLIENSRLRKLAVNHYAKQIVKSNPDSVLKDYVDTSTNVIGYSEPDSAPAKTVQVFNKFIDIGGKTALVGSKPAIIYWVSLQILRFPIKHISLLDM